MDKLDARNGEALLLYHFVQDQTQYIGSEGVVGPLPLTAVKAALEILEVPHDSWLELIHRVRILHGAWTARQNSELKSKRGKPQAKEAEPNEMLKIPFAKKVEGQSGK